MHRILLFASAVALATSALANDSTAGHAAGGLVLQRTDAIEMVSEDLYVSAKEVRVDYLFHNRTPRDVDTIVAFPMPDRSLSDEYGGDQAYPSNFRTLIDGKLVSAKLERKAVVGREDHSALLARLRVPISPDRIAEAIQAMDRLPAADKKLLQTLKLAGDEEYDNTGKGMKHHLIPLWTVREKYWWKQRFAAGREVRVQHRYVPGAGGSVDTVLGSQYFKPSDPEVRKMIARYCIDQDFLASVNRLRKANQVLPNTWIDYVLTTGANWARPIADFRLVVDKGKPSHLLSFCGDGVKKIGPTQFELRHKNWRPEQDLHIFIIHPGAWQL